MKSEILLSIILISYNHSRYIERAIESVLSQKINYSYEVIFADDNSTDETRKIISKYAKKFKNRIFSYNNSNLGASRNYLNAFKKARGKYIVTLECDDFWINSSKLTNQLDFLLKNDDYIGVADLRVIVDKNENILSLFPANISEDIDCSFEDCLKEKTTFSFATVMFKNIFLMNIFDKKFEKLLLKDRMIVDTPFSLYLLSLGKIRLLNQANSAYRTFLAGNTTNYCSRNKYSIVLDHILITNRLSEYFYDSDFRLNYAKRFYQLFRAFTICGNYGEYKRIRTFIPKGKVKFMYVIKYVCILFKNKFLIKKRIFNL